MHWSADFACLYMFAATSQGPPKERTVWLPGDNDCSLRGRVKEVVPIICRIENEHANRVDSFHEVQVGFSALRQHLWGSGVYMMQVDDDSDCRSRAECAVGAAFSGAQTHRVADSDHECVDRGALLFQAAAQLLGCRAEVDLVLQPHQTSSCDEDPSVQDQEEKW